MSFLGPSDQLFFLIVFIMALRYILAERRNPMTPELPGKYYAKLIKAGNIDERGIASIISNMCTVKYPDILAVLLAYQYEVVRLLLSGFTVQAGDLGTFYNTFEQERRNWELLPTTAAGVTPDSISRVRMRFRAGQYLKFTNTDPDVSFVKIELQANPNNAG